MDATTAPSSSPAATVQGRVTLFSSAAEPTLELLDLVERTVHVPFSDAGAGRTPDERMWVAEPTLPLTGAWRFRVSMGGGVFDTPNEQRYYETDLRTLWLQDTQVFAYEPAPYVSPARVIKVDTFKGSLPTRALYIYLPRGYDEQPDKRYPVLYMHDGQNVFETFVEDSYAGSWRADEVANTLIACGKMRECLIVGVSNGAAHRLTEYLPPYASFEQKIPKALKKKEKGKGTLKPVPKRVTGRADETFAYYQGEVAPYLKEHYRVLEGREHTATCGSSMGGLFSAYIAWEHPAFARQHAIMSASFWMTRTEAGTLATVERFRSEKPPEVRLWLGSGTGDPNSDSDDNMHSVIAARDALLANGFKEGENFRYYLDEGAIHHESAWAARLDKVFNFLLPVT